VIPLVIGIVARHVGPGVNPFTFVFTCHKDAGVARVDLVGQTQESYSSV
jgi:hypothetical protein